MNDATATDRALDLLRLLVQDKGRAPLGAHAAALGLPLSTAYRMVEILRRHGLVAPAARGHYVAGLELIELARQADRRAILAAAARPLLRRLARDCQATAHLGILEGDMITYLVKEHGGRARLFTVEGGQLEAYCSAVGRVLLANLPDEEREAYLESGPFVALTAHTVIEPQRIRELLIEARCHDYAVDDHEIVDDLICFAVPVRGRTDEVLAAISLATTAARRVHEILPALRGCANRLRLKLGSPQDK